MDYVSSLPVRRPEFSNYLAGVRVNEINIFNVPPIFFLFK